MHPPDLKSERAACQDSPVSQSHLPCTADTNDPPPEFQAASRRRLFSLCRAAAHTIASLAFAGGPR
jgi:hypothetical protein